MYRHQRNDVVFESSAQWLPTLQMLVVQLGQQLQGASASPAFPCAVVLEELEEISSALTVSTIVDGIGSTAGAGAGVGVGVVRGWSTRCFYDIGFSHGTLVESYIEIFDRWAGKAPEKLLHILSSTTFVLLHWTRCVAE